MNLSFGFLAFTLRRAGAVFLDVPVTDPSSCANVGAAHRISLRNGARLGRASHKLRHTRRAGMNIQVFRRGTPYSTQLNKGE
jgi:hypothetical protein